MVDRRPDVPLPFAGQKCPTTGRKLCAFCGTPVPPRRHRWCSDDCVERYLIAKGDQNAARRWCWSRDFGVCQLCRLDTVEPHELQGMYGQQIPRAHMNHRAGKWDADHTIPIVEGGAFARENLRTLCRPCHQRETAALRKRMAEWRVQGAR